MTTPIATHVDSVHITSVLVLDQDEALAFYRDRLGFVVTDDLDLGFMRWLTVAVPSQPDRKLLLELAGGPGRDEESATALRELITKGALGGVFLTSTDARADYQRLVDAGVEIAQEPTEQPYGLDFGIRDPFGNHLRISQPNGVAGSEVEREYEQNGATFS